MKVFNDYSRYYNLLYKDKDYSGETEYIEELLHEYSPQAKTILELGCGTGKHADLLSQKFCICGVDMSKEMIFEANKLAPRTNLTFSEGNICSIRLNKKFDAIISLFHVMSYQTTNSDLQNTFKTVHKHLKNNGIFIFDSWYGPGVLTDRPAIRIKRLEDEKIEITRIAEPVLYPNENVVDVNYQVFIKNKIDNSLNVIKETHKMRYLFKQEIEAMLNHSNLKLIKCEEWLTRKEPDFNSWNVTFIVKK